MLIMPRVLTSRFGLALLWAVLVFSSIFMRPLMPVDETRYAAVAWEMWQSNDFLVPHLNGETYSHKPPLLFWLIQLTWWLFGVNDWSLRLISPLFALANLFLTGAIARLLWPNARNIENASPFILLGSVVWTVFSTLTMFDIMLTFFVLIGIFALLKLAKDGQGFKAVLVLAVAIGGGVLTKGPVILLHLLPAALLMPWWLKTEQMPKRAWYWRLLVAVLGGAALALFWAIPAGMAGVETYGKAIFLGQTSGRVVNSFAHKLPWWWYLQMLPVFFIPWVFTRTLWSGFIKLDWRDSGIRFCLIWILPVLLAFSLISGKRLHYLLPLMPAFALIIAQAMTNLKDSAWRNNGLLYVILLIILGLAAMLLPWLNSQVRGLEGFAYLSPLWGLGICSIAAGLAFISVADVQQSIVLTAAASVLSALLLAGGFFSVKGDRYDTAPAGQKIAELQAQNFAVAFYTDKYHGQFQFGGRLAKPIGIILGQKNLLDYAAAQPENYLVVTYKPSSGLPESAFNYRYPYKNVMIGMLKGRDLTSHPELVKFFVP